MAGQLDRTRASDGEVHDMKWPDWLGFAERTYKQADGEVVQPSKTVWDWLQLLIVPAVLAGAVTIYNQAQTDQANRRQAVQAAQNLRQGAVANQDSIFQTYLSQMSSLMVAKDWSKRDSSARRVGRVLTLGFLSALDRARKGEVLQFLFHAQLLGNPAEFTGSPPGPPLISLANADLRGADLTAATLEQANLTSADLTGADLKSANLRDSNLNGAFLERANLSHAILNDMANLSGADLTDANLTDASLSTANLENAILNGANLSGAQLGGATLSGADLSGADLTGAIGANLRGATLNQTTCPNGHVTDNHC
jgi:uncharacterized protein YjbI with pentapeptide repeats